ncbi:MAG: type II secretion system GspH family protein [Ruminococcus sp.]|nr:type II secretion system GspH family protein [Ruminococcus sp.]
MFKFNFKAGKIKAFNKRYLKSKCGTTLVELVCTITILGIVSSASLGAMFGMTSVAKNGQKISVAERSCALLTEQLSIYGNTANRVKLIETPSDIDWTPYDDAHHGGLSDGTVNTNQNYVDYFISASQDEPNTILLQKVKYTGGVGSLVTVSKIENIEYIQFYVSNFEVKVNNTDTVNKYVLNYSIKTTTNYEIDGGVVLNNVDSNVANISVPNNSNSRIIAATKQVDGSVSGATTKLIQITSTNRELVSRT